MHWSFKKRQRIRLSFTRGPAHLIWCLQNDELALPQFRLFCKTDQFDEAGHHACFYQETVETVISLLLRYPSQTYRFTLGTILYEWIVKISIPLTKKPPLLKTTGVSNSLIVI